jgi:hypothetical protein
MGFCTLGTSKKNNLNLWSRTSMANLCCRRISRDTCINIMPLNFEPELARYRTRFLTRIYTANSPYLYRNALITKCSLEQMTRKYFFLSSKSDKTWYQVGQWLYLKSRIFTKSTNTSCLS